MAAAFEVPVSTTPRTAPVRYLYETPVHPAIRPGSTGGGPIAADGDVVVGFGMIETEWTARGDRVVIDPQHSEVADLLGRVSAPHRALVLNEHEARRFAGHGDLRSAARHFLELGIERSPSREGPVAGWSPRRAVSARSERFRPVGSTQSARATRSPRVSPTPGQ